MTEWASEGATVLLGLLGRTADQKQQNLQSGCNGAKRFTAESAIDAYLAIYARVLASYGIADTPISRSELART